MSPSRVLASTTNLGFVHVARLARAWLARQRTALLIWNLTVTLGMAGAWMAGGVLGLANPPDAGPSFSWWLIAPLFFAVETFVVHLPARRDAHTISTSEIPLVLGFFLSAPNDLLLGRLVGVGLALAVVRRQAPVKLAFNLAQTFLANVLSLTIFRAIVQDGPANVPRGWLAALVAVAAEALVSTGAVAVAIRIHDPGRRIAHTLRCAVTGWFISLATALVAINVLIAAAISPWATVFVGIVVAGLVATIKLFGTLWRRHLELEDVYSFTRALEEAHSAADVIRVSVVECASRLRADAVHLVISEGNGNGRRHRLQPDGSVIDETVPNELVKRLVAGVGRSGALVHPDALDLAVDYPSLAAMAPALAVPVLAAKSVCGVMLAGSRTGPERSFTTEELELAAALVSHAAVSLERAQKTEALRAEIEIKQQMIRSKDRLIAAVSHELRTPLTGVVGFAEVLRDEGPGLGPDRVGEMASIIAKESLDMSHIVEDLLTAARARNGGLVVQHTEADLVALTESVLTGWEGINLEAEGSANAICDPPRVRQILRNLVSNARLHGGEHLVVRVRESNNFSVIQVCDDGPGVPPDAIERIFQAYESGHVAPGQPGSVGLGLWVAQELARLMSGDLLYRREQAWSVFELRLPRVASRKPVGTTATAIGGDELGPPRFTYGPARQAVPAGSP